MNNTSRTITGTILFLMGLIITIISSFTSFIFLIYGIPVMIVGVFIFFNKKEDQIEQIKSYSNKRIKKEKSERRKK